jgi:undecaprenyl-diphosphatase
MAKDGLSGDLLSTNLEILPIILGAAAAFISGLLACNWMIALVKRSQLKYFSYYCFIVGLVAIRLSY